MRKNGQSSGKLAGDIRWRVIRGTTRVASRNIGVLRTAHYKIAGRELSAVGGSQFRCIRSPGEGEEEVATGPKHPDQLLQPRALKLRRQVCEDRERVSEAKRARRECERRVWAIDFRGLKRQVCATPGDLLRVDITPRHAQAGFCGPEMPHHASTATTEVKDRLKRPQRRRIRANGPDKAIRTGPPNPQVVMNGEVIRADDQLVKRPGREWQLVWGSEDLIAKFPRRSANAHDPDPPCWFE